jgi:hypothetical protein
MKAMPAWFRLALSAPKVSVDAIVQYPSDPRKLQSINGFLVSISAELGDGAGVAIAASRATLALVGGWEPEKVWVDWAGSVCGLLLVLYPIFGLILWFFK